MTLIKKGQHLSRKTEFKKGQPSPRKGVKKPGWTNQTSFKRKGKKYTYQGLHTWVRRNLGSANNKECIFCHGSKNLEWANISHKYKEDLKDWMVLCKKCHCKYDDWSEKMWKTRRENLEIKKLVKLIKKARFCFVAGNGGSAANAEHLTNDLFSKGIKAICLNSNVSIMTMLANDFGYKSIYSKQLEIYATFKDLLITISCSGTSPNIVKAENLAVNNGIALYRFETFKKGDKDFGKLEDKHQQLIHKIKEAL